MRIGEVVERTGIAASTLRYYEQIECVTLNSDHSNCTVDKCKSERLTMRNLLGWIIYIPVQVAFIPFAIVGSIVVGYRNYVVSGRLGVSGTAVDVNNTRWMMTVFDMRDDDALLRLNRALPNNSFLGLWAFMLPLYLFYRITGKPLFPTLPEPGEETLAGFIQARTQFLDRVVTDHHANAEQLVIMGAGFDTRCYGEVRHSLKCFELDEIKTQTVKREALANADVDTAHVTFVGVDFAQPDWFDGLLAAGYDPHKRTVFIWEGVSLYLSEEAVRNTLQTISTNAASGSVLGADFYTPALISGAYNRLLKSGTSVVTSTTGERFDFGLPMQGEDRAVVEAFVSPEGFSLGKARFLGSKTRKGTFAAVTELIVNE